MNLATPPGDYSRLAARFGPMAPYGVELMLPEKPERGWQGVLHALRSAIGEVDQFIDMPEAAAFGALQYRTEFSDEKNVPMTYHLLHGAQGRERDDITAALEQSQTWPGARSAVARSRASLRLHDMPGLDRVGRLGLFHRVLRAVVAEFQVVAIHWLPSQRMVDPAVILDESRPIALCDGAVNVRMFQVADGEPGELMMDSCGLASFGLPDVQLRYVNLDPNRVAARLFGIAAYLFEKGDVIGDGDTVDGIDGRWRCRREASSVTPSREVLALSEVEERPMVVPRRRSVQCPQCGWVPGPFETWECTCGMMWNPFDTGARCPACGHQHAGTECHKCGQWSEYRRW